MYGATLPASATLGSYNCGETGQLSVESYRFSAAAGTFLELLLQIDISICPSHGMVTFIARTKVPGNFN